MDQALLRQFAQLQHEVERLQALESGAIISAATSFPTTPLDGQLVFRTDRFLLYAYNVAAGNLWLTINEYSALLAREETLSTSPVATPQTRLRDNYDVFVTRVSLSSQVAGTNNGLNFWTLEAKLVNVAGSATTTVYTTTTAADANNRVDKSGAPSVLTSANDAAATLVATKTGTPGNVTCYGTLFYRLIG
jgi:hypothetical protein